MGGLEPDFIEESGQMAGELTLVTQRTSVCHTRLFWRAPLDTIAGPGLFHTAARCD
jgi:hypothetical protein